MFLNSQKVYASVHRIQKQTEQAFAKFYSFIVNKTCPAANESKYGILDRSHKVAEGRSVAGSYVASERWLGPGAQAAVPGGRWWSPGRAVGPPAAARSLPSTGIAETSLHCIVLMTGAASHCVSVSKAGGMVKH